MLDRPNVRSTLSLDCSYLDSSVFALCMQHCLVRRETSLWLHAGVLKGRIIRPASPADAERAEPGLIATHDSTEAWLPNQLPFRAGQVKSLVLSILSVTFSSEVFRGLSRDVFSHNND